MTRRWSGGGPFIAVLAMLVLSATAQTFGFAVALSRVCSAVSAQTSVSGGAVSLDLVDDSLPPLEWTATPVPMPRGSCLVTVARVAPAGDGRQRIGNRLHRPPSWERAGPSDGWRVG